MINNRPQIDNETIEQVKALIDANPQWNRTRISKELCSLWDWRSPNGQLKDISCRDLLRDLDRKGAIGLPKALKPSRTAGTPDIVAHLAHDETPYTRKLKEAMPLRVEVVKPGDGMSIFKSLIDQYHYLGFDRSVGESVKYMVYDNGGIPLACLSFGSSAWACRPRDEYIGWDAGQRAANINLTTNNTRFLIFPWVRVPHLASHILALVARRVCGDWFSRYGHPVHMLETFVERGRFAGTAYKAANWRCVGSTTGRGRNGVGSRVTLPIKDVYVYPIIADFRRELSRIKESV